jgi:hypothetical protein
VVESLSNAWEGLKLKLFDVIDGPLISIGKWFSEALSGGGPQWLKDLGTGISDTFSQAGNVLSTQLMPVLKQLWESLKGPLAEYGKQWVATFKEAWPIIKTVGAIIGGALLVSLKGLSVTLPIVVKVMTAVITVMQGVYAAIKGGVSIFTSVAQAIGGVFVGAWHLLQGAISAAWAVISPVWNAIKTGLSALGQAGKYVFDTVLIPIWHNLELAAGGAWALMQPIFNMFASVWHTVADAATAFWQGAIVPVWEGVKGAFSAGWQAIQPVFEQIKGAFQGVKDFVSTVWSGLAGIVKSAFDGVIGAVKGPLHWLGGVLQKVPLKIGPVEIPGAQAAKDLGNTLAGLAMGGVAGRDKRGRLFGPGTGTSDSILGVDAAGRPTALVSTGEGVVKADAMKRGGGAAVVDALNRGASLADLIRVPRAAGGLNPGADWIKSQVQKLWPQITNIGGYRPPDGYNEHSSGNALDIMIPDPTSAEGKALGDAVAAWITENAEALGLTHFIWQQRIFKAGDKTGSPMEDRGSPTANHMDHVHAWFQKGGGALPNAAAIKAPGGGIGGSPTGAASGLSTSSGVGGTTVDPAKVREAEQRVADADQRIAEADAKVREEEAAQRELKGTATESQRISAQRQLDAAKADADKARREKQDAESGLAEAKAGTPADSTGTGADSGSKMGEIGSIAKQFLSDTFGLGDLLPDPSELGIVKLFQAMAGIKYTPQGKGFPWQGGPPGALGAPAAGGGDILGALGSGLGLPTGMIPGVSSMLPDQAHGGTGVLPGPAPEAGAVDASTNITIQNPQMTEASNVSLIRRTLLHTPRLGTNSAPQGIST